MPNKNQSSPPPPEYFQPTPLPSLPKTTLESIWRGPFLGLFMEYLVWFWTAVHDRSDFSQKYSRRRATVQIYPAGRFLSMSLGFPLFF